MVKTINIMRIKANLMLVTILKIFGHVYLFNIAMSIMLALILIIFVFFLDISTLSESLFVES